MPHTIEFFTAGDLIQTHTGKTYKYIRDFSHVNYLCEDQDGKQWRVRKTNVKGKAPEGMNFATAPKPELPTLFLADPVQFKGAAGQKYPGTHVLIKHLADGYAQFAKLEGHSNAYVRAHLSIVTPVKLFA